MVCIYLPSEQGVRPQTGSWEMLYQALYGCSRTFQLVGRTVQQSQSHAALKRLQSKIFLCITSWWPKTSKARWAEATEEERTNGGDYQDKKKKKKQNWAGYEDPPEVCWCHAEKAESQGKLSFISKSNGLWRAAKEKERRLESVDKQRTDRLKELKDTPS